MKKTPTSFEFQIDNIRPINEYISECDVKVFYEGKNRNGSYISKAVGTEIAKKLPRTPIVAVYNEQIDDYEDHGQEIVINRNGINFISKTVAFGAVSELSEPEWKLITDYDGVTRNYMVCKGYLWTGRYPHLQNVLNYTKGQSMEFFPESVKGDWAKFSNEEDEFFIINEASISGLCILGDDVEPCFEGAAIGAPGSLYSLKVNDFKEELVKFMYELNDALKNNTEGGTATVTIKNNAIIEPQVDPNASLVDPVVLDEPIVDEPIVDPNASLDEPVVEPVIDEPVIEPTASLDEPVIDEPVVEPITDEPKIYELDEEAYQAYQNLSNQVTQLNSSLEELQTSFTALKAEYDILNAEKQASIDTQKDNIFEKFSILGEEILGNIKKEKDKYSVEDIEDKLSAIAFKKGITFETVTTNNDIFTPTVPSTFSKEIPDWLKAVEERINNR